MNTDELLQRLRAMQNELASLIDDLSESSAADPLIGGVDESARLVALNMALGGTPREETERYLTDNFTLADPQRLLDEVYTNVRSLQ